MGHTLLPEFSPSTHAALERLWIQKRASAARMDQSSQGALKMPITRIAATHIARARACGAGTRIGLASSGERYR